MTAIWRSPFFVFDLFEQSALVIIFIFGMSLKYMLSLIRLKKSFKSRSISFLLYTFRFGIKFKFLFKKFVFGFGKWMFAKLPKSSWFIWWMNAITLSNSTFSSWLPLEGHSFLQGWTPSLHPPSECSPFSKENLRSYPPLSDSHPNWCM